MIYMIDIDGTICSKTDGKYEEAIPYTTRIKHFNKLYDAGNQIHYWTARGAISGIDWLEFTTKQLDTWGVKYTTLKTKKPNYDIWIDDKAMNVDKYFLEYV